LALRLPGPQAEHNAAAVVEPPLCRRIVKGVIDGDLSCNGELGNESGFVVVDQRVSAAVRHSNVPANPSQ
jgi:hypothetical protein